MISSASIATPPARLRAPTQPTGKQHRSSTAASLSQPALYDSAPPPYWIREQYCHSILCGEGDVQSVKGDRVAVPCCSGRRRQAVLLHASAPGAFSHSYCWIFGQVRISSCAGNHLRASTAGSPPPVCASQRLECWLQLQVWSDARRFFGGGLPQHHVGRRYRYHRIAPRRRRQRRQPRRRRRRAVTTSAGETVGKPALRAPQQVRY